MPSAPPKRRRPTMSAKSTPGSLPPHRTTESEDAKGHVDVGGIKAHQRSPSVLAKALQRSLNCKSAPPGVLADEDEDGESIAHLGRVRIEVEGEGRKKYSTSRTISRASRYDVPLPTCLLFATPHNTLPLSSQYPSQSLV